MTVIDNHDRGNNNPYSEHFYVPGTVLGTLPFTVTLTAPLPPIL